MFPCDGQAKLRMEKKRENGGKSQQGEGNGGSGTGDRWKEREEACMDYLLLSLPSYLSIH